MSIDHADGFHRRGRIRAVPLLVPAALVVIVCVWFATGKPLPFVNPDPVRRVVAAASPGHRAIEARLSGGFAWAPVRRDDRVRAEVLRVAHDLMRGGDASPNARHAAALAQLIAADARQSLETLNTLASRGGDAAVWNDLAAAQYVVATREDEPSRLARALAAADAALRIDPKFAEARFNRALILDALRLRDVARSEWEAYLVLDPASPWATEAREHVRLLAREEPFRQRFERTYEQLLADPPKARELARSHPQDSRAWGETEILGRWAADAKKGDVQRTSRHLAVARELGAELVRNGGDPMLQMLVAAVDGASLAERAELVEGHDHLLRGMQEYRKRRIAQAERIFTEGAPHFVRGGSPGQFIIGYYTANTIFDQGRIDEAGRKLEAILDALPPQFRAQRAHVLWQHGGVAYSQGRWGAAIEEWGESAAIYESLRELTFSAIMHSHLVFAYDRVGDPRAWESRMIALRQLGRFETERLQQAVASVTYAALMDQDWPVALSFLALEIDMAHRVAMPLAHIEALICRAEVGVRTGDRAAAAADLDDARRLFARLEDASDREYFEALADAVQASLTDDPVAAAALLDDAIDFHRTKGRRAYLPALLKQRGDAFRSARDVERARADFEAGIVELEQHRESLPEGEKRWGVFHAADDLFAEAIDLALERRHVGAAFEYAERARARALLDTFTDPLPRVTAAEIPAGTVLVEYAVQKDTLVIFVVDDRGLRAVRVPVERDKLVAEVAALARAAERGESLDTVARTVHRRLVAPVEKDLIGRRRIAFVPDGTLTRVPFAALMDDDGRFLVERHAISVQPSAAVFARLRRGQKSAVPRATLIVSGSHELGALSAAERESREVARLYPGATRLTRVTAREFARAAADAGIIHFSGHAVETFGGGRGGYLLFASEGNHDGRLDVQQIAALRLPRTSTVVLAACGTGSGEVRGTEGTISIARAFLATGVPSVVATLWPIEDGEAARFFPAFHRRLAGGLAPAEALRATQLEWIARRESSALWAATQVIGE